MLSERSEEVQAAIEPRMDVEVVERDGRKAWRRPTVTRIAINTTLSGSGAEIDGGGHSNG